MICYFSPFSTGTSFDNVLMSLFCGSAHTEATRSHDSSQALTLSTNAPAKSFSPLSVPSIQPASLAQNAMREHARRWGHDAAIASIRLNIVALSPSLDQARIFSALDLCILTKTLY